MYDLLKKCILKNEGFCITSHFSHMHVCLNASRYSVALIIYNKTTECHILLLAVSTHTCFNKRTALLEFTPLIDVSIGTVEHKAGIKY